MCLLVIAYRVHPDYPIVVAANRDEFYDRPTRALHDWGKESHIVAGRDLKGGGTWMGINRQGRLAALTNYREPDRHDAQAPSRGHLVSDFLKGPENLNQYINKVSLDAIKYNGFNLVLLEGDQLLYFSNRSGVAEEVRPGIHGLSNGLLNTPWPKVTRSCRAVKSQLNPTRPADVEALMHILGDRSIPPDYDLPRTGVGLEWERRLGSIFIRSDIYGTRSSTVLLVAKDGTVSICERTFDQEGFVGEAEFVFQISDPEEALEKAVAE